MAVMKAYQREYINKLVTPNRKEYALTLKNIGTIDQDTILEEAADHSRLDVDTLRHALNALTNTAVLYLKVGHGVQFGNFGSLQPSINVKAVTKKEDCNVKTMIGGAKNSQHMTGQAADITVGSPARNHELFQMAIDLDLRFDQLIDEKDYRWIHVSYSPRNRRQILHLT